jgi:hypothetical protein
MDTTQYRTLIAGGVLLALVGATIYIVRGESGDTQVEDEALPTLPELTRDSIDAITITRPGEDGEEEPIVLTRVDDAWRVTSPVNSATAESAIDAVLDKLTDLEVVGVATRNPSFHERLEVDEAQGVRVQVTAGGEAVLDFRLGAYRSSTTMLRLEGEDAVLQMRGSIKFAFNKPLRDWRDRTVTDLAVNDLTAIEFVNENGTFRFRREAPDEGDEGAEEEEASSPAPWVQVLEPLEEGGAPLAAIEEMAPDRVQSLATSAARVRASSFEDGEVTESETGLGDGAGVVRMVDGEGAATVLYIGSEADEERHERYARVEGNDTIFVLSRFLSERLLPGPDAFVAPEPGEEETAAEAPEMPTEAPGGGQIPPEVMQQIQQQLRAQQGGGHP